MVRIDISRLSTAATCALGASLAGALLLAAGVGVGAQSLTYSSGQHVIPAYEGWEEHADRSRYFVFGYMNRNWEEELDVPVGPENGFNVGGADQGQPTHFLPRRNRFVFRVPVPKNFTEKDEFVWTLSMRGKTERAYGTLRVDYKMDDIIIASETGALGAGSSSPEIRANKAPTVKVQGPLTRQTTVGQPLTLEAIVSDDGVPKNNASGVAGAAVENEGSRPIRGEGDANNPRRVNRALQPPGRATVGKYVGLHLTWLVYRGAGTVTFDPDQIASWEDTRNGANSPWAPIWAAPKMPSDGKVLVRATFDEPGTYVLRSLADDGALLGHQDVTVVVAK
jgi:hypothetical protein